MSIKLKQLELSDKDFVVNVTSRFQPYSDYNFLSMWSWDVRNELRIGDLNGNLVVKFNDYVTGDPFYSFLGDKKVGQTAGELLEMAKAEGLKAVLKLVPEECASALDQSRFLVEESRDNFDYIYPLEEIRTYSSNARYRQATASFVRKHGQDVRELYLHDQSTQDMIFKLIDLWVDNKLKKAEQNNRPVAQDEFSNEYEAVRRLFRATVEHLADVKSFGVFVGGQMAGFLIDEKAAPDYCISHFGKVNVAYAGAMQLLMQNSAEAFKRDGVKFYNDEQDLGLDNLRASKSAYGPSKFLKKHTVSLRAR